MNTLIPNCYNCGRKHGGKYTRKNSDVGVICKQCKDKENKIVNEMPPIGFFEAERATERKRGRAGCPKEHGHAN